MGVSIITRLGLFVKGITGIKDFSMLKKKIHKEIGKLVYHKTYTANDIVREMQRLGMKKGSVVCIHASMMEFYNYKGTAIMSSTKRLLPLRLVIWQKHLEHSLASFAASTYSIRYVPGGNMLNGSLKTTIRALTVGTSFRRGIE